MFRGPLYFKLSANHYIYNEIWLYYFTLYKMDLNAGITLNTSVES